MAPQLAAVEADSSRDAIHVLLAGVHAVDPADTAEGAGRRSVGVDGLRDAAHRADPIGARQRLYPDGCEERRLARVSPRVEVVHDLPGDDLALGCHSRAQTHDRVLARVAGHELVAARVDELDGTLGHAGDSAANASM